MPLRSARPRGRRRRPGSVGGCVQSIARRRRGRRVRGNSALVCGSERTKARASASCGVNSRSRRRAVSRIFMFQFLRWSSGLVTHLIDKPLSVIGVIAMLRPQPARPLARENESRFALDSFRVTDSGALSVLTENKQVTRLFSGESPRIPSLTRGWANLSRGKGFYAADSFLGVPGFGGAAASVSSISLGSTSRSAHSMRLTAS